MFSTGFSATTEPHALEILMARQIRHLAIPNEQRNVVNPIPVSAKVLKKARAHFADHCASCHANDGSGKTPIGGNVYPKAPDWKSPDTQSMSDGELFWVIHNGIRFTAMAASGAALRRSLKTVRNWSILSITCRRSRGKNWMI